MVLYSKQNLEYIEQRICKQLSLVLDYTLNGSTSKIEIHGCFIRIVRDILRDKKCRWQVAVEELLLVEQNDTAVLEEVWEVDEDDAW